MVSWVGKENVEGARNGHAKLIEKHGQPLSTCNGIHQLIPIPGGACFLFVILIDTIIGVLQPPLA